MKYIDAEKLIAEIERLKERAQAERVLYPKTILAAKDYLLIQDYDNLLSFITSLQQEQLEVDLEKEMDKFYGMYRNDKGETYDIEDNEPCFDWKEDELAEHELHIAHHFYKLGLNARKED